MINKRFLPLVIIGFSLCCFSGQATQNINATFNLPLSDDALISVVKGNQNNLPTQSKTVHAASSSMDQYSLDLSDQSIEERSSSSESSPSLPLNIHEDQTVYVAWLQQSHSWFVILGVFFILGLLLAFTPCVLPMMPILISILAKYQNNKKPVLLTLSYIIGSALTYALIGVLIGLFGATYNLQIWFQSPGIILSAAVLFLLLALSMWGFYDLRLPQCIQNKLQQWDAQTQKKKASFLTIGLMGSLSSLIVSPCLTAPLIGVLVYISSTQQILLGGLILFSLGLGMGMPLLLIGFGLDRLIPRSGLWLVRVKQGFSLLMLGIAIGLMNRLLSEDMAMMTWGSWLIFSTGCIGFWFWVGHKKWFFGLAPFLVMTVSYGAILIAGGVLKQSHWINPFNGLTVYPMEFSHKEAWLRLEKPEEFSPLKQQLLTRNKCFVVYFSADWCTACQDIKKTVLNKMYIKKELQHWSRIHFDVTKTTAKQLKFMKDMNVFGVPTLIFYGPDGLELKRNIGMFSEDALLKQLDAWPHCKKSN